MTEKQNRVSGALVFVAFLGFFGASSGFQGFPGGSLGFWGFPGGSLGFLEFPGGFLSSFGFLGVPWGPGEWAQLDFQSIQQRDYFGHLSIKYINYLTSLVLTDLQKKSLNKVSIIQVGSIRKVNICLS